MTNPVVLPVLRPVLRPVVRPVVLRLTAALALAGAVVGGLSACAPLLLGGAVLGGGLVVSDRRTAGIQLEDESIELRAGSRVRELATLGQISITSYNRLVLLTGEVPAAEQRAQVEQVVAKVENVRGVINELVVAPNSSLSSRTADNGLATKVKLTLVDAKDVQANAYKVVAQRRVVYLMGRVTEREAARGAELASQVSGAEKVVKVFEIINEKELATPSSNTPAPVTNAAPTVAPK